MKPAWIVFVAVFAALTLGAEDALSLTYYVSPSGSDSHPCTLLLPCASFDRAYQVASPGDEVEVAGGSYPSQVLEAKPGAQPPNIVIREAVGQTAVVGTVPASSDDARDYINCMGFEGASYVEVQGIETPYGLVDGEETQCGVSAGRNDAHHVVFRNVDVGHVWVGADDVQVLDSDIGPSINEITTISDDGADDSERVLFEGNAIHDFTRTGFDHVECAGDWSGDEITWRDNHFYNCEVFHIWTVGEPSQVGASALTAHLIEGNLFTQPDPSIPVSSTIRLGDHGGSLDGIVVRNNRVWYDELFPEQGLGDGAGRIDVTDNDVLSGEEIVIQGQSCHGPRVVLNQGDTEYTCGGNTVVTAGAVPACSDGADNDDDGTIDVSRDLDCDGALDTTEGNPETTPPETTGPTVTGGTFEGLPRTRQANLDPSPAMHQRTLEAPAFAPRVGVSTNQPEGDYSSSGEAEAVRQVASASGNVDTFRIYVPSSAECSHCGTAPSKLVVGLYSHQGRTPGKPDALLTSGTIDSVTLGAWHEVGVTPVDVTSGTVYWLAVLGPEGFGRAWFENNCCGDGTARVRASSEDDLSTLPASWTTGWSGRLDGPFAFAGGS